MEKKILLYPGTYSLHTAHKSLINNPPRGYRFMHNYDPKSPYEKYKNNKLIKRFYRLFVKLTNKNISEIVHKKEKISEDIDLIFSMGELYTGNKPWVLEFIDSPYGLTGYNYPIFVKNKKRIEEVLMRKNCKKIICGNETLVKFIKENFASDILKKTTIIRSGIGGSIKVNRKFDKGLKILFMGSIKNSEDFYLKGGLETIRAFEKLQGKYPEVRLVIRSKVPKEIKRLISKNSSITLIENFISDEKIGSLYKNSDVLSCPAHTYMLMSWLEAMSYGLSIVVLDTYAAEDYVTNGENGFLIKPSSLIPYSMKSYPTNVREGYFLKAIKDQDDIVINALSETFEKLLVDINLRKKLAKGSRRIIDSKFTLTIRNKKIKTALDEVFK